MTLPTFSAPKYPVTIPSSEKQATIRPFTAGEEKILLMAVQSGEEKEVHAAIKQVVGQCLEGENVNNLTFFDLEYLFLQLRIRSQGQDLIFEVIKKDSECEACQKGITVKVDLNDAKVEGKFDKKIKIEDDRGVVMKYPTFNELTNTLLEVEKEELSDLESAFRLMCSSVDYVYDSQGIYKFSDYTKEDQVAFLQSMDGRKFKKVEEFYQNLPQVTLTTDVKCKVCGNSYKYTMRGIQDFFG